MTQVNASEMDVTETDYLNDSPLLTEAQAVVRTGPVQLDQIDQNSIIGTILYQGNVRKRLIVTKYHPLSTKVSVRDDNSEEFKVPIETLFWSEMNVTEAQAVVRTGPVQLDQIDQNSIIGTILYQGNVRKRLIVTKYNPLSAKVSVRDEDRGNDFKVPIETLFWSTD